MQFELGVADRIQLLDILPREGDSITIKVIHDLRTGKAGLGFSEEELDLLKFERVDGFTKWQRLGDRPKKVEIGNVAHEIITATLRSLEAAKKLTEGLLHVYQLFVEDPKPRKVK